MTKGEAVRALKRWHQAYAQRDAVVRLASEAGVTKQQIHELTGIARTTIDRILKNGGKPDV